MRTNTIRRSAAAGSILALTLTLAACGGEEETPETASPAETESSAIEEEPTEAESAMESESAAPMDAPFGPGCAQVPTSGEGSVEGMTDDPVATAASNNPLLKTLVAAVTEADLVETLNAADALTVFAPAEPAFAKIPAADIKALLADKPALTQVLTHHVVAGRLSPEDVVGTHETLNGDMIEVTGSGENIKVGDDEMAAVLCGNVQTANATVYVIDTVQMP